MKRYQYTCKLLSDIVISSVTATEGFNPSLDYIPGAKFLGVVAKEIYGKDALTTLDLFHSGKVRFGDAYPLIEERMGLPVPFSWFFEKGKGVTEPPVYLHHLLSDDDFRQMTEDGKQLKQARKGYFDIEGRYLSVIQDFAIRSAYNRDELRADDGKMFGYFSLPEGSTWSFTVEDDTEQYGEQIKAELTGEKRIGRSRSAEYGLVEIKFEQSLPVEAKNTPPSKLTLIYALSNLCFYNEFGKPTVTPTPTQLGAPGGEIIWGKSQIRSRIYQTWNRHRHNRDADRIIIERGSVFAIKHSQPIDTAAHMSGIGSHKAEGFGRVLIDPTFLLSNDNKLNLTMTKFNGPKEAERKRFIGQIPAQDTLVLNYLRQRETQRSSTFSLDEKINEFVRINELVFQGISHSQWGTIRAYAKHAPNWEVLYKLLFDKDFGALYRGQSEADWREKDRRGKLSIFLAGVSDADRVSFTLKLAAEMAKRKNAKETA